MIDLSRPEPYEVKTSRTVPRRERVGNNPALSTVVRYTYQKRNKGKKVDDKAVTIGTGLAVGGSFVIPIMILLALL